MEGLRLRSITAAVGIVLTIIWVMPNIMNFEKRWWFSKSKLNYGLDIQGGLHLVMGVDVAGVVSESSNRMALQLKGDLSKEGVAVTEVKATKPEEGEVQITFANSADTKAKIEKRITDNYSTMLQVLSSDAAQVTVRYYDAYLLDYKNRVLQQSIETIRNRIDEFGVAEP